MELLFEWDKDKAQQNLQKRSKIIRLISARKATSRERHTYEEEVT